MEYNKSGSQILVRLDADEEICAALLQLAKTEQIDTASITGIGAVKEAEIGSYNFESKQFESLKLHGSYELSSLMGNLTRKNNVPDLHLHTVLGDSLHNENHSGHLLSATVSAVAEIFIILYDGKTERRYDPERGYDILHFEENFYETE